jgi:hypothetical protein
MLVKIYLLQTEKKRLTASGNRVIKTISGNKAGELREDGENDMTRSL